jgi:hypothetical protein
MPRTPCSCQWKGNAKVSVCQACHMRAISYQFGLEGLRRLQAMPVENRVTRKFAFWPVRDPKSKKLRFGRVSIHEQTYITKPHGNIYIRNPPWMRQWQVVEVKPRRHERTLSI